MLTNYDFAVSKDLRGGCLIKGKFKLISKKIPIALLF